MIVQCPSQELTSAMSTVQRAMPSKSPMPALEGVLLEAKDNAIRLTCSDLALSIACTVPAMVEQEGALVLPGRMFSELIRKMPQETVSITTEELKVTIICGQAKYNLQGMDAREYPEMPPMTGARPLELKQSALKNMIQRTAFAVAMDETKPILTGELLEIESDQVTLVALDGYRLALCKEPLLQSTTPVNFVVPGRSLSEIAKLFEDSDAPASIYIGDTQAMVEMGQTKIITRLLEGEYINYRQILPGDHQTRVRIQTQAFLESVERASLMARDSRNHNLIRLQMDEETMVITANGEMGNAVEKLPIYLEGKPLSIAFNAKYLLDVLRVIKDEEILLDFISSLSPCVVKPLEGNQYLYLVLPVRV
jgi:DNA polymerase-3 subunit beta